MRSITEPEPTCYNYNHNARNQPTPRFPSSRRTPSTSSTSSLSSSNSSTSFGSPPPSPATPIHRRFPSGGVPFSWESIPGIPKTQILKKIDSCHKTSYLPLPPPVSGSSHKKHITTRKDPFFTALVECSKGNDDNDDSKALFGKSRSISDRFGFGFVSMSCKNSSVVTESLVFLPKGTRKIAYDMVKKRAG